MKKYFLLTISSLVLVLILVFGSHAYNQEITETAKAGITATKANNSITPLNNYKSEAASKPEVKQVSSTSKSTTNHSVQPNQISSEGDQKNSVTTTDSSTTDTSNNISQPTQSVAKPVIKDIVSVSIQGLGEYTEELGKNDTGWTIMLKMIQEKNIILKYQRFSFGIMVTQIGNLAAHDNYYWALYHNGTYSQVGISDLILKSGDTIEWKLETW